ncbi:hypothetical protein DDP54_17080 (plasmid) [Cellulomonas sp. WB94]|uniref:hypothetical protein n=1 Tax=Cellulomonas sp. WB94 TaxID=2173174 RepID=UPI000D5805F0|nr:hypothetical protein [Cellulomonas sp. WB94]PVU81257.1 hypothetical protein DDP54_17080 [Cellulomonas sp. WB94]
MIGPVSLLVVILSLALAAWALWFVVRDRAVILRQLWGGAVVEAVLVVQAVVATVLVANGTGSPDRVLFGGYVVVQLLILPIAAIWAFEERTRWSSVLLLIAAFTTAFLEYRLLQIWGTL